MTQGPFGTFEAFRGTELSEHLHKVRQKWQNELLTQPDAYLLNVNEEEYCLYLLTKHQLQAPALDFTAITISSDERPVPAEHFPSNYNVRKGRSHPRTVVIYHLPYTGDFQYFRMKPSQWMTQSPFIKEGKGTLDFELVSFDDQNTEELQREAQGALQSLRLQLGFLIEELDGFNLRMADEIRRLFKDRKERLLKRSNLLESLGVPLKASTNVPTTFVVPTPELRKKIPIQPVANETDFQPEFTLEPAGYQAILKILYDVGKVMERLPDTYSTKGEEALRDHLLMFLTPWFEGTVTGETFNRKGKTDILLRHQNSNLFVAECKFWKGRKAYLQTLDQLLGYLTWRDSKAAVVVFADTKDITTPLQGIREATPEHPQFLKFQGQVTDSWFEYRFHLPNDPHITVHLAVLVVHVPGTT